jgi:hypothetical protein
MFASKSVVSAPIKPIVPITIKVSSNGKTDVNIADGAATATFDSLGDLTTEQAKASLLTLKNAYSDIKQTALKSPNYEPLLKIHEKLIALKNLCKDFTPATKDKTTGSVFTRNKTTINAATINSSLLNGITDAADGALGAASATAADIKSSIEDAVAAVKAAVTTTDPKDILNKLGTNTNTDVANNELAIAIDKVESAIQADSVAAATKPDVSTSGAGGSSPSKPTVSTGSDSSSESQVVDKGPALAAVKTAYNDSKSALESLESAKAGGGSTDIDAINKAEGSIQTAVAAVEPLKGADTTEIYKALEIVNLNLIAVDGESPDAAKWKDMVNALVGLNAALGGAESLNKIDGGKRRRKTNKRKRAQNRKGRRTMNRRWY